MKAKKLKPDGTHEFVEVDTLKDWQREVGGFIEHIRLRDGNNMLVDEEGLMKGLDENVEASSLAGALIVGSVLIFGPMKKAVQERNGEEFTDYPNVGQDLADGAKLEQDDGS